MDSEIQQKIKDVVLEILKTADMEATTEYKVRKCAAEKLGLDLSLPDRKQFVREVVESFLKSQAPCEGQDAEQEQEEEAAAAAAEENEAAPEDEEDEEGEGKKKRGKKEYDDEGDLIICRLSNKRRVTIQDFRGKTLVSIREYYEKDGKQLPSSKGISLTAEQWEAFSKAVPKIEDAIKKLEGED